MPISKRASQAIRSLLLNMGPMSIYDIYKWLRRMGHRIQYNSVAVYVHTLTKLGLIRPKEQRPSSRGGFPKTIYEIVPGREDHPCWWEPKKCYEEMVKGKRKTLLY